MYRLARFHLGNCSGSYRVDRSCRTHFCLGTLGTKKTQTWTQTQSGHTHENSAFSQPCWLKMPRSSCADLRQWAVRSPDLADLRRVRAAAEEVEAQRVRDRAKQFELLGRCLRTRGEQDGLLAWPCTMRHWSRQFAATLTSAASLPLGPPRQTLQNRAAPRPTLNPRSGSGPPAKREESKQHYTDPSKPWRHLPLQGLYLTFEHHEHPPGQDAQYTGCCVGLFFFFRIKFVGLGSIFGGGDSGVLWTFWMVTGRVSGRSGSLKKNMILFKNRWENRKNMSHCQTA